MERQPVPQLILALIVAAAPLMVQLPLWAVGWCVLSWGYVLIQDRRGWPIPSRVIRITIFLLGITAVLVSAGLRFDGGDFITLLAVMAGIKPLEIQRQRDSMVTVFLAYFLIITSLFVFENLAMTLYLFVSVWVTTGVLIHVNQPSGAVREQMGLAARLIVVAVPLMVLLFLLFPRVSGDFWGSPWSRSNRSGFSNVMRMGDVSRLVLVDAPAFSVTFSTPVPEAARLYWRGIVFQRFDGVTWHPAGQLPIRQGSVKGSEMSSYTVILEPHGHRHLFVLDLPVTVSPVATIMADHTVAAQQTIWQRFHYGAASFIDDAQPKDDVPGRWDLHLPPGRNPKSLALGHRWAKNEAGPEAIIDEARAFFREAGFHYSLKPGRLGRHAVDDFLFDTRKGFCEHYAAAFATLMRAAGVPTRIVAGYQGGKWNPLGGFLTVRQSDAHAWCEVWLAGDGWVRVDPTFEVAPDRIDIGIESALEDKGLPEFLGHGWNHPLVRWTETVRQTWEAVNLRWNIWFMGFSAENQMAMLKQLGISIGRQGRWMLVMTLPLVFIAAVMFLVQFSTKGREKRLQDPAFKIYGRFLKKMARVGFPKPPHQGPVNYANAVVGHHPTLSQDIRKITQCYIALRYGSGTDDEQLKDFYRRVRRFNPRPESGNRSRRTRDEGQ